MMMKERSKSIDCEADTPAVLAISRATCVATKLRDKLHSVIAPYSKVPSKEKLSNVRHIYLHGEF